MQFSRRSFLMSAAAGAAATGIGGALSGFSSARAADTSGYKALVCVFLFGGMDHYDTVFPYDEATYGALAGSRQTLMDQYGGARARTSLLPLTLQNQSDFGARLFALPPEMPGLQGLFNSGDAAIMGNVGPLIAPTTTEQFLNESVPLPPRLFSHNDQQSTWQASGPEGTQVGWGGLFADAATLGLSGNQRQFATMSTNGNSVFVTGNTVNPFQIGPDGGAQIRVLDTLADAREDAASEALYQAARRHFRAADFQGSNLIGRDYAEQMRLSVDNNEAFNAALGLGSPVMTAFPATGLGEGLKAVADAIAIRTALGVTRQIFFVGIGGFDTHATQATVLPGLQTEIDGAVTAFHQAMVSLNLSNDVTLFTMSDFGRTLAANGDGTDHGWAGHHFVVGGAVDGGRIFGDVPIPDLDDAGSVEGSGRLVPTHSVEEYAAPLGRWFGLTASEIDQALPNLANFPAGSRPEFMVTS